MRTVRCVLAAGLAACLAGGLARAEEKKEPTTADKLVGSWVVTKAPAGLGWIQGTTLKFKKDGKLVIEVKPGAGGVEGTYTVEGGAVTIQDKAGRVMLPIKTLTGDKLALGGQDGIECAKCAKQTK
jgi:uncharacterized protein (TIGR03066 family)